MDPWIRDKGLEPIFSDDPTKSEKIVRMKEGEKVSKVQIFGYFETGEVHKVKFFDSLDNVILEAGYDIGSV